MTAWIIPLLASVLACTLCELLLPDGEQGGTRRHLHFLTALLTLLLLAQPLLTLVHSGSDLLLGALPEDTVDADYGAILQDAVQTRSRAELERGLYALLLAEHGIASENAALDLSFSADGTLQRVRVILSGKALLIDPSGVEQTLRERFSCEVEVR